MDRLNVLLLAHQLVIECQQYPQMTAELEQLIKIASEYALLEEHCHEELQLDDEEICLCLRASVELCLFNSAIAILAHCPWMKADQMINDGFLEMRIVKIRSVLTELVPLMQDSYFPDLLQLTVSVLVCLLNCGCQGSYANLNVKPYLNVKL